MKRSFSGGLLAVLIGVACIDSNAQVCGISASKLNVPDASVISIETFEFEPSINVFHSSSQFGEDGKTEPLGGKSVSSDLLFRVTASVSERLEIGTAFSRALEQIDVGSKLLVFNSEKIKLAAIAGLSIPAGNKFISDLSDEQETYFGGTLGGIASFEAGTSSSVDASVSFSHYTGNRLNKRIWCGLSYGTYVSQNLQLIGELGGFYLFDKNYSESKFNCAGGFSYKVTSGLILVMGFQYDLFGRNTWKGAGYQTAFTMLF
ncbi:MAG: hypothetical protein WC061_09150 [Melioribacteraceae bacterium]